jgi:hypothetical protein
MNTFLRRKYRLTVGAPRLWYSAGCAHLESWRETPTAAKTTELIKGKTQRRCDGAF